MSLAEVVGNPRRIQQSILPIQPHVLPGPAESCQSWAPLQSGKVMPNIATLDAGSTIVPPSRGTELISHIESLNLGRADRLSHLSVKHPPEAQKRYTVRSWTILQRSARVDSLKFLSWRFYPLSIFMSRVFPLSEILCPWCCVNCAKHTNNVLR